MKKTTKLLAVLASGVLLAGNVMAMTSCGGSDKDSIKNTTIVTGDVNYVAYDGGKVTVTFYHTMGAALKTILERNIERFNKDYPNIEIKHKSYGDYPGVRDQIKT